MIQKISAHRVDRRTLLKVAGTGLVAAALPSFGEGRPTAMGQAVAIASANGLQTGGTIHCSVLAL